MESINSYLILALFTLFFIFILFLVISRTINTVINLLIKLEFFLQKEFDLKQEALEVRKIMEEQVNSKDGKTGA